MPSQHNTGNIPHAYSILTRGVIERRKPPGYREIAVNRRFSRDSARKNNVDRPDYYHRFGIVVPRQLIEHIS